MSTTIHLNEATDRPSGPYASYIIQLDQGDYLEERGGYDWGRVGHPANASRYDTPEQAEAALRRLRPCCRARVVEY